MTQNPLDALKERFDKIHNKNCDGTYTWMHRSDEYRDLYKDAIALVETYRTLAINKCQRSFYMESWKEKEELIDSEAKEILKKGGGK